MRHQTSFGLDSGVGGGVADRFEMMYGKVGKPQKQTFRRRLGMALKGTYTCKK
jgi:hypothetical protein